MEGKVVESLTSILYLSLALLYTHHLRTFVDLQDAYSSGVTYIRLRDY
jgi:hypothetical protein